MEDQAPETNPDAPAPAPAPGGKASPGGAQHVGGASSPGAVPRPSYRFLAAVAGVSLVLDVATKAWAHAALSEPGSGRYVVFEDHLAMVYARNPGGAWGLLQDQDEWIRRPFFLVASCVAVAFIVSLYTKLQPEQRALRWGLPLVLGGALGNLADRVARGEVVDFIDYRAGWVETMNVLIAKVVDGWHVTAHWPTFNVADISICTGVGLMALDMFTQRRAPEDRASDAVVDQTG